MDEDSWFKRHENLVGFIAFIVYHGFGLLIWRIWTGYHAIVYFTAVPSFIAGYSIAKNKYEGK